MLTDRGFFAVAVLFYGVSFLFSIFLLRQGFRQENRFNYFLILAALIPHTIAMAMRGFNLSRCPIHNLYEATTFIIWTIAAAYAATGWWSRLRFLGAFASPVLFGLGVFALMPSLDPPHADNQPNFGGGLISAHAALISLAYGAFGLSAISGGMYLMQDRNLKYHKLQAAFSLLPPIQRLEGIMNALVIAGFILLTGGLALTPVIVHQQDFGAYVKGDAKILWSIVVWGLYLALVLMRWAFGQHGKRLAWGAVATFAFVMLTFWGFNLLSPIHNPAS
jgi:ABC-type transport system involved in cytochrome c biogenesis permease subunit